jgi:hydroxymethylglutaryl-CoA synthase
MEVQESSIFGYGVYLPRFRIKREEFGRVWGTGSIKEKSVAGFDEDVVTMGVEAAQNALEDFRVDPSSLEAVFFATSSPPKVNSLLAPLFAMTLGCRSDIRFADFFGIGQGGTAALRGAFDAINSGQITSALVVCSDDITGAAGSGIESSYGAGAVALVIGRGKGVAQILSSYSYGTYFPYSWRNPSEHFIQNYGDPRFERLYGYEQHVTSAIQGYLVRYKQELNQYQHLILPEPDGRAALDLAKKLKATSTQTARAGIANEVGDLGAAGPFLSLARIFEEAKEGERILLASYGNGASSDVLGFKMLEKTSLKGTRSLINYLKRKEYIDYARYARMKEILVRGGEKPAVPTSLPAVWRSFKNKLALIGSQCKNCGIINYPSRKLICIGCRQEAEFEDIRLERKGKIYTVVTVHYAPPGIEGPYGIGIAELPSHIRILGRLADCDPAKVEIDQPVELILRRLMEREGIIDYGYALRPMIEEAHDA